MDISRATGGEGAHVAQRQTSDREGEGMGAGDERGHYTAQAGWGIWIETLIYNPDWFLPNTYIRR